MCWSSKWSHSFSCPHQNPIFICLLPCVLHTSSISSTLI
jgi:hypothetical protein